MTGMREDDGGPLRLSNRRSTDKERGERDVVLRTFVRLPLRLVYRRAHCEAASWDRDHLQSSVRTECFGECCRTKFLRRVSHALLVDRRNIEDNRPQRR